MVATISYKERLRLARIGMPVADRNGVRVGFVRRIARGDPLAVDGRGQRIGEATDLLRWLPGSRWAVEPRITSPQAATRLVREGYIEIDGRSLGQPTRYAAAEEIVDSADNVLRLGVPYTALAVRRS